MAEFVVSGAEVFDGERSLGKVEVHARDEVAVAVGGPVPDGGRARRRRRGIEPGTVVVATRRGDRNPLVEAFTRCAKACLAQPWAM